MAIDKTDNWSNTCLLMSELVKEGRIFTWRKSYDRTKNMNVVKDFHYIANIYEVRQTRYHNMRVLGSYDMATDHGLDEICSDLFSLSLTHNLIALDSEYLEIVVERSKNGQTNINDNVMEAMMDIQKKIVKQLGRRKAR